MLPLRNVSKVSDVGGDVCSALFGAVSVSCGRLGKVTVIGCQVRFAWLRAETVG